MGRSDAAIAKLSDPKEQDLVAAFLLQRAVPFAEYWEDALECCRRWGDADDQPGRLAAVDGRGLSSLMSNPSHAHY
jgi:hypothetical protein